MSGSPPASLDAVETTVPATPSPGRLRRHVFGAAEREAAVIVDALRGGQPGTFGRRVARLLDCCMHPAILVRDDGSLLLAAGRCRDRLCPACSKIRAHRVSLAVAAACRAADSLRFITLTIQSSERPLMAQVDHLLASFRRLRRDPVWGRHVKGGAYTLEVTRNPQTGRWHPHLHVLADGCFFPHALLSSSWKKASRGSPVCHLAPIRSIQEAARYVAKYATKPGGITGWPPEAIREYAIALHARRMVHTFGSLHGVEPEPPEQPLPAPISGRLYSRDSLIAAWQTADDELRNALGTIASLGPAWRATLESQVLDALPVFEHPPPDAIADAVRVLAAIDPEPLPEVLYCDASSLAEPSQARDRPAWGQLSLMDVSPRR